MSSATGVDRASDEAALRALFTRLCEAWTAGDADAYGACFTSDCSYVSFDGARATGRDAVVASHDALFRGVLFGSALVGHVEGVQFLGHDAALVHGTGSVQVAWRSQLPRKRATRNTMVAVRHPAAPEGWLFAAIQNTRIRPQAVPGPDTFPARAARGLVTLAAQAGLGHAREVRATR
jgi:uncharacterized protein (TIGR02246 family)